MERGNTPDNRGGGASPESGGPKPPGGLVAPPAAGGGPSTVAGTPPPTEAPAGGPDTTPGATGPEPSPWTPATERDFQDGDFGLEPGASPIEGDPADLGWRATGHPLEDGTVPEAAVDGYGDTWSRSRNPRDGTSVTTVATENGSYSETIDSSGNRVRSFTSKDGRSRWTQTGDGKPELFKQEGGTGDYR